MNIITDLLIASALYCGVMYAVRVFVFFRSQGRDSAASVENDTFHLGLCFILALGFLGLILKIGG